MAIKYQVVKRKILKGDEKDQIRYFGMTMGGAKISFDDVCQDIADRSTATAGDAEAVLGALIKIVYSELKAGHIVELGRLGRLHLTAGSKGVENEEDVTAQLIKQPKVRFTPGKSIRKMLDDLSFVRAKQIVVYKECDKQHIV